MADSIPRSGAPVVLNMDSVSPVTRIIAQRKQMETAQNQLDAQREEYLRKEEMFRLREDNLRKRDLELQEALVLFNKFLKENEHKRRRAQEREREERRNKESKIKEIEYQLREISQKKQKLKEKRKLNRLCEPYQKFLNDFLNDTTTGFFDDHPSIEKVEERFKVLERAETDLRAVQLRYTRTADEYRAKIANLQKKLFTQTLQLNNSIVAESQTLEQEVVSSTLEAARWRDEEAQALKQKALYAQLKMGIANMAKRCDAKEFSATLSRIIQYHAQNAHSQGYHLMYQHNHQSSQSTQPGNMTPSQIVTAAKAGVALPTLSKLQLPSSLTYVGQGGSVGANCVALLKRQPTQAASLRSGGGGSTNSLNSLDSETQLKMYGIDSESLVNSALSHGDSNFNSDSQTSLMTNSRNDAAVAFGGGSNVISRSTANRPVDQDKNAKGKPQYNPYGQASTVLAGYAGPTTARSRRILMNAVSGEDGNTNGIQGPEKNLNEAANLKAAVAGVTLPGSIGSTLTGAAADAELAQLSKWLKAISNRLNELNMMTMHINANAGSLGGIGILPMVQSHSNGNHNNPSSSGSLYTSNFDSSDVTGYNPNTSLLTSQAGHRR